jgi:hypothetical protein
VVDKTKGNVRIAQDLVAPSRYEHVVSFLQSGACMFDVRRTDDCDEISRRRRRALQRFDVPEHDRSIAELTQIIAERFEGARDKR